MLPALNRLSSDKEILATVKQGRRLTTKHVFLYVRDNGTSSPSRVACVAGKKVDLSSVKRHLQQRRLRELARKLLPLCKDGLDMVWIASASMKGIEMDEVEKDVVSALSPYTKK